MVKKVVRHIILIVNLLFVVLLLIAYLSVYISPAKIWGLAFFGLMYPFILIGNIFFVVLWLYRRRWYFAISLLTIFIGFNHLVRIYQFPVNNSQSATDSTDLIQVMSYNVRLFNRYNFIKDTSTTRLLVDYIKSKDADIVCLQEYYSWKSGAYSTTELEREFKKDGYSHVYFINGISGSGMATFSRFPIVKRGVISFKESNNMVIYSDVVFDNDTIRIYNCHLQSVKLKEADIAMLDDIKLNYSESEIEGFKNITSKLKKAFIQRAQQVEILSDHISKSPHEYLICGDFNDTPNSYTYRKIKADNADAYMEAGSGFGNTYVRKVPSFRIDYVFHSDSFNAKEFNTGTVRWSDHFPIYTTLVRE